MSYCRLGADSDIYCYYHVDGYYEVWSGEGEHRFDTAQETINFLRRRKKAGDKVPDYAFEQLEDEDRNADQ